jgi:hypothetical protein
MAYGTKYYIEFYNSKSDYYQISLQYKEYTGSVTDLYGDEDPLVYDFPEVGKYAPVKGLVGNSI